MEKRKAGGKWVTPMQQPPAKAARRTGKAQAGPSRQKGPKQGAGRTRAGTAQQLTPAPAPWGEVWSGMLEWTNGDTTCQVSFSVASVIDNGKPQVVADDWPLILRMQLMVNPFMTAIGKGYTFERNSKTLLFLRQHLGKNLQTLSEVLSTECFGLIRVPDLSNPSETDPKIIILKYVEEEKSFLGYVPHNQTGFSYRLRLHNDSLAVPPAEAAGGKPVGGNKENAAALTGGAQATTMIWSAMTFCYECATESNINDLKNFHLKLQIYNVKDGTDKWAGVEDWLDVMSLQLIPSFRELREAYLLESKMVVVTIVENSKDLIQYLSSGYVGFIQVQRTYDIAQGSWRSQYMMLEYLPQKQTFVGYIPNDSKDLNQSYFWDTYHSVVQKYAVRQVEGQQRSLVVWGPVAAEDLSVPFTLQNNPSVKADEGDVASLLGVLGDVSDKDVDDDDKTVKAMNDAITLLEFQGFINGLSSPSSSSSSSSCSSSSSSESEAYHTV